MRFTNKVKSLCSPTRRKAASTWVGITALILDPTFGPLLYFRTTCRHSLNSAKQNRYLKNHQYFQLVMKTKFAKKSSFFIRHHYYVLAKLIIEDDVQQRITAVVMCFGLQSFTTELRTNGTSCAADK